MPYSPRPWPDTFDYVCFAIVGGLAIAIPLAGYVLIYRDYRAYLRSLRTALVHVRRYTTTLPEWARRETPPCLAALGLRSGSTRADVLAAYRQKVKAIHPDTGGDRRDFARLQQHFEQAMELTEPSEPDR